MKNSGISWGSIILFWIALFGYWSWSDHENAVRLQQQAQVLASIEAIHTADTSAFVRAWADAHQEPSAETVSSLTVMAAQIKNDPARARSLATQIRPDATFTRWLLDLWRSYRGSLVSLLVLAFLAIVPLVGIQIYKQRRDGDYSAR